MISTPVECLTRTSGTKSLVPFALTAGVTQKTILKVVILHVSNYLGISEKQIKTNIFLKGFVLKIQCSLSVYISYILS